MADGAIEVFFSYSHKDETLRNELAFRLVGLQRGGLIRAWHDRQIEAGSEWAREIDRYLNSADIILLLVSHYFLASDYCWSIELQRAMERHEAGGACVVPVILSPVDWTDAPFAKLQAFPKDAKPITTWSNQNEAFYDVAQGIRRVVKQTLKKRQQAKLEQQRQAEEQERFKWLERERQRKADELQQPIKLEPQRQAEKIIPVNLPIEQSLTSTDIDVATDAWLSSAGNSEISYSFKAPGFENLALENLKIPDLNLTNLEPGQVEAEDIDGRQQLDPTWGWEAVKVEEQKRLRQRTGQRKQQQESKKPKNREKPEDPIEWSYESLIIPGIFLAVIVGTVAAMFSATLKNPTNTKPSSPSVINKQSMQIPLNQPLSSASQPCMRQCQPHNWYLTRVSSLASRLVDCNMQ